LPIGSTQLTLERVFAGQALVEYAAYSINIKGVVKNLMGVRISNFRRPIFPIILNGLKHKGIHIAS
jgi:hypothetical protein